MRAPSKQALTAVLLLHLAAPLLAQGEPVEDVDDASPNLLDQIEESVLGGTWWLRLRYRIEHVDQDGISNAAWASTLRTVLGWESAPWHGASVVLEFEDVSPIGPEDYDSTVNGKTDYPVVADPDGSEVNQVYLKYVATEEATVELGRQVITLDNHRFVGDVGWRQNQQTFDAASVAWKPHEDVELFGAFVGNVNRVFGDDSPQGDHRMASGLLNAAYDVDGFGRLTAYAYLLDYDTVDTLSSNTVGARFTGSHPAGGVDLLYTAELASQMDAGSNPNKVDEPYLFGELGARVEGFTLRVGHETLGGSGDPGDAFQTPLATLHRFNGWADKFLVTPDSGLVDFYVQLGQRVGDVQLAAVWHQFEADTGGLDYGTELDASLTWKLGKVETGLKLAAYDAEDFATDTTKAWLWIAYAP